MTLKSLIENDIDALEKAGIKPVFVFNGIGIVRKDKPFSSEDTRPQRRTQAWDAYERGRVEQAISSFGSSGEYCRVVVIHLIFQAQSIKAI